METRLICLCADLHVPATGLGLRRRLRGATDVEIVHDFCRGDPTDGEKVVNVPCPSGKIALGGGFELAAGDFPIDVQYSEPMGQLGEAPTGWAGFAQETPPLDPADEWSFDVFAVCASP